jgi:dephospho-CoA kinase
LALDVSVSDFVVGVSGGIGSGKTTVTDLFAEYGIEVIDADVIARQVVEPGTAALAAIVEKFGKGILDPEGCLNRAELRSLVFNNNDNKTWLNQLLHPAIRQMMLVKTQQAKSAYCLLSVPLLVENNLYQQVDRVLIVDVLESTQLERAVQRDQSNQQQIQAIMKAQATREQRLAVADDIIDNNGATNDLVGQVNQLHLRFLQLAREHRKANSSDN